ncbi:hypothetical protein JOC86_001736 [Bacillus pakistanensis]|uniref:DUF4230 domain-containing protein n=1 Tax=Rossellomorea pakistanensis TaxID=992288 RepID=A0ABS2NBF7_9BACI|nr:DUF4230 domain-containing protein [Bacillus pakistanensis]MBM7585194.1 hypothetical protein [Bacillus pakistanensis]
MSHHHEKIKEMEAILQELKAGQQETGGALAIEKSRKSPTLKDISGLVFRFWKSRVLILLLLFALIVSGISIGVYSWLSGDSFKEEKGSFVEKIREMSSLATAQGYVKAVIEQEDNQIFGKEIAADIPGTKRKLLIVVPGTVLAGVDLKKIKQSDISVNEDSKEIFLTLPEAEILQAPSIHTSNIELFSVEGVFRSEVNWEEGFSLADDAKELMKKEATDQGLLEAAEKNAKRSLKEFFEHIGYKVTFK